MAKNNYRYDIAMLRLLCIILVVLFHAYGMMYAAHFSEATSTVYHDKYYFVNQTYGINVAMPMFVFISGFLFGTQLKKGLPNSLLNIVRNKCMRLMLPFFLFTTMFMFTQNAVSLTPFYQWTYSHLWFLPMLFWCFISAWFLRSLILSNKLMISCITLIILFSLSLLETRFEPLLGLHSLNVWLCWFALGMWFYKHEASLLPQSEKLKICIIAGGFTLFTVIMTAFPQPYAKPTIVGIIATLTAIYSLWVLFAWIPWKNLAVTNFLMSLSICSFGIYIFHYWLQGHLLSRTAQRVLCLEQLAQSHCYLFPIVFAMVSFTLSAIATWAILKFNIGRKLIG